MYVTFSNYYSYVCKSHSLCSAHQTPPLPTKTACLNWKSMTMKKEWQHKNVRRLSLNNTPKYPPKILINGFWMKMSLNANISFLFLICFQILFSTPKFKVTHRKSSIEVKESEMIICISFHLFSVLYIFSTPRILFLVFPSLVVICHLFGSF